MGENMVCDEYRFWRRPGALAQNNDQELEPILQSNSLLKELIPLSQSLQTVATTGLQAVIISITVAALRLAGASNSWPC